MTFPEILTKLMLEHDLSNVKMGKIVGVSDTAVMKWKKGISAPGLDTAAEIADYFGISLDELYGRKTQNTEQFFSLPLVGAINAGFFTIESEEEWSDRFQSVSLRALRGRAPKECVLLEVVGDSMEPLVHVGEMVVVHRQNTAVNGNIVVIWDETQGGYTMKTFHQDRDKVELIPANAQYEIYTYSRPEWSQLSIYGVCISAERSLV